MLHTARKALAVLRHDGPAALGGIVARKAGWSALAATLDRRARERALRRQVLSMLTPAEIAWTETYARERYCGAGAVVDLGCWLGSSTIALARGLARNRPSLHSPRIQAYDRFVWEAWMDPIVAGTRLDGRYRAGDSFLDEFRRQIQPWQQSVAVHAGDLLALDWSGASIELLFIDVMKSWPLANRVVRQFFPHLVPGKSVVVHQDFVHYYTAWIALLAWRFRDYFEPEGQVPGSPSVIFRCTRAVPPEMLAADVSFASFTEAEFEAAFAYAGEVVSPESRGEIRLARIMAFVHQGDRERAARELAHERGALQAAWGLAAVEKAISG